MHMADWEIERPLGQCCGTGQRIEPGQQYVAALVETEQGLQRRDFCREYWDRNQPQVYCYWKTTMPQPDQKRQIFVDDHMLLAFFERLAEETDPEKVAFRFVIALVLMRKRRLKYDSARTENKTEIWRLRVVGADKEFVEVKNPRLDDDRIEQLSSQIGRILQVEL